MKSIFTIAQPQFTGTNNRLVWINSKLTYLFDHPMWLLAIPWASYYLLDLAVTLWFGLESKGFAFANITVICGFLSSCVFFFWLFPALFYAERGWLWFSCSIGALILLVLSRYFMLLVFQAEPDPFPRFLMFESLRMLQFLVITFALWIFYSFFKTLREKKDAEIKLEELELAHKSLQLSPHFLLNLIGDITGKSIQFSQVLFEDLRHYTTILRYGYLDPGGFNSLAAEIDTVLSYLHCQRLRFGESLAMAVDIDRKLLEMDECYMPKMLLLTVVENIFKHGVTQSASHPMEITAKWEELGDNPGFLFKSKNLIKSRQFDQGDGFGLSTVQRLLSHYFREASCQSARTEQFYTLSIFIAYDAPNQTRPD